MTLKQRVNRILFNEELKKLEYDSIYGCYVLLDIIYNSDHLSIVANTRSIFNITLEHTTKLSRKFGIDDYYTILYCIYSFTDNSSITLVEDTGLKNKSTGTYTKEEVIKEIQTLFDSIQRGCVKVSELNSAYNKCEAYFLRTHNPFYSNIINNVIKVLYKRVNE